MRPGTARLRVRPAVLRATLEWRGKNSLAPATSTPEACEATKIFLTALFVTSLFARAAGAQAQTRRPAASTPVGVWRGTSVCLARPSACNDEIVVYRISPTNAPDSLTLDARKIVRGEEEAMGILTCRFTAPGGTLTCAIPRGTWQFRVRNDSLVGELRLADNTKFREVRTVRSQGARRSSARAHGA